MIRYKKCAHKLVNCYELFQGLKTAFINSNDEKEKTRIII